MQIGNTTRRWGAISQALHWLIVVLIVLQYVLAEAADDLPAGPAKLALLARHKSIGVTILALALLRLVWRSSNPTPLLPERMPRWERWLARATHTGLYVGLFAMPLTGWMMSSARNFPVSWFGLVQLPDLVSPSTATYERMHEAHESIFAVLLALALLHMAGALKHHFIDRDDVLLRMLPGTRTRSPSR
ncbi:MAG: cytochrome b [Steroidobacteraceae bacterium]|nr:cytochrome b [Steroidobacteraceae bacterium]MDW8260876.1 cytochrome b [Gammaproteobacteria bacterium]